MTERREERVSVTPPDMGTAPQRSQEQGEGANPVEASASGTGESQKAEGQAVALFSPHTSQGFRSRWESIQTGFVDEPRRAVEQADDLVAEVMKRLVDSFADERSKLESQWGRGDNVSTEDLRMALQRYRLFFDRLLTYGMAPDRGSRSAAPAGSRTTAGGYDAAQKERTATDQPGEAADTRGSRER